MFLFSNVPVTFYLFTDTELCSGVMRESGTASAFRSCKFELLFIFLRLYASKCNDCLG